NPLVPNADKYQYPKAEWENNEFILTLKYSKQAVDYDIKFEVSSNLYQWSSDTNLISTSTIYEDDYFKTIQLRYKNQSRCGFVRWLPVKNN
ncbi:MAG TPA: hypothetical protein PLW02_09410, partial [Verrucomicrobiota bacterium]|nr:hypothetical protein [Verrucomicrobiota bacterium]